MNIQEKLLCAAYALTALIALPATWVNNIFFMTQVSNNSLVDFVYAAYSNAAAASLSNALILVAAAACLFMIFEGRRLGIRFV